ncbi:ABC transporter permease [Breznakia pachnodae]|uniref:ABC transport system permease protein n=1 Tax=Breznakia pachnodae TaxID=265178 RepID=A0ABU0E4J7_9FIRM|nr:ABC transporter permease [Breznakia pachnodae]MDQ0361641.1 putative ABC transport system permease protein [Breznakia pachnodae]
MYFKLAMQNVKKSYKDYFIYFLTLAFSVCLFYTFNSFQAQQAVLDMTAAQSEIIEGLAEVLTWLSVFVALVLGFLILYSNNFLIKRRKKEFGLYTLLGMPKGKMSKILVYETFLIGLISLIVGMLLGIGLSQVLTVVTAGMFTIPLNYSFVFSVDATMLTIFAFSVIFIIVMIFNTIVLRRYKLIDLLYADRKNEILKVKNVKLYVLMFLVSIGLLGTAYYMGLSKGIEAFNYLNIIIPLGLIGTLLFFLSLAGFLLRFVQTSKRLYFRNLNMFVLREVNSSIKSNFISMSFVCILLLFSIGALSIGLSLNSASNTAMEMMTPYDLSVHLMFTPENRDPVEDFGLDEIDGVKNMQELHVYYSELNESILGEYTTAKETSYYDSEYTGTTMIQLIKLSEYNQLMKDVDMEPLELKDDEIALWSNHQGRSEELEEIVDSGKLKELTLSGKAYTIKPYEYELMNVATTRANSTVSTVIIINDNEIADSNYAEYMRYYNFDFEEGVDVTKVVEELNRKTDQIYEELAVEEGEEYNGYTYIDVVDHDDVYTSNKGVSVLATYVGIYLGITFLIASAAVLSLQQLSKASDNKRRYLILEKMGADDKMIRKSVLLQLLMYFMIPLALAIVHSIVGIQVVNTIVLLYGKGDIFASSLMGGGCIVLIYGVYFFVTYKYYCNIVKMK